MNKIEFIKNFEAQFDEVEPDELTENTVFKLLDEWSSLNALLIISMIDTEYNVAVSGDELNESETIDQVYELVKQKMEGNDGV